MKKYLFVFSLSLFCIACGNNSTEKDKTPAADTPAASPMDNPDYDKGLNLIAKSDCLGCHKIREASTGPAYGDIANKYENNETTIDNLADKVIKGGQGVWGQVPMAAHPALSKDDARQMVKYIMLLKEEKK